MLNCTKCWGQKDEEEKDTTSVIMVLIVEMGWETGNERVTPNRYTNNCSENTIKITRFKNFTILFAKYISFPCHKEGTGKARCGMPVVCIFNNWSLGSTDL